MTYFDIILDIFANNKSDNNLLFRTCSEFFHGKC